jgi:hypothetical protein
VVRATGFDAAIVGGALYASPSIGLHFNLRFLVARGAGRRS